MSKQTRKIGGLEVIRFKPGLYREFPRTVGAPRAISRRVPTVTGLFLGFFFFLLLGFQLLLQALYFQSSGYELYNAYMMFAIFSFFISGVLGLTLLVAGGLIYLERRHRTRRQRRPRWRRMIGTPHDQEDLFQESANGETVADVDAPRQRPEDVDRNIPDWLIPLLRNRSTARAIHEDLVSSADTSQDAESQFQSHIDDLDTEIITVYQNRRAESRIDEVLKPDSDDRLTEAEIEKEAVLDLLGALELQYKAGKVSQKFYKRKRNQLLERLAKANSELD